MVWDWFLKVDGYNSELQNTTTEVTPNAGPNFKRQTSTNADEFIKGTLILSQTERDAFRLFYLRDTKQGQEEFQYYDPILKEDRTARFYGTPKESKNGQFYTMTVSLRLKRGASFHFLNWFVNGEQLLLNGENAQLRK